MAAIVNPSDYPSSLVCVAPSTRLTADDEVALLTEKDNQMRKVAWGCRVCDIHSKVYILNPSRGIRYKVMACKDIGTDVSKLELQKISDVYYEFSLCSCC
jgi:hypothetical protein